MAGDNAPLQKVRVICTADDFGIGHATSRGIVSAHLNGPVTCTSVMTTRPEALASSVPLLADAPDLELGLHFVWSGGGNRPVVAQRSSGFVTRLGTFCELPVLWARVLAGRVDRTALEDELAAQLALFRSVIGRNPAYVDGHHHAHQLPPAAEAIAAFVGRGELPALSRLTLEAVRSAGPGVKRFIARTWARRASDIFQAAGIRTNDHFFGMLLGTDLVRQNPWGGGVDRLTKLPPGKVAEWVVHPGERDASLMGVDPYIEGRPIELEALIDGQRSGLWDAVKTIKKTAI